MENITDKNKKKFMSNIIIIALGLIIFAALSSLILNFSFGIILFSLGIFVDGTATVLGAFKQVVFSRTSPLPETSFEGALFFSGFTAIVISAPFLWQIMF